MVMEYVLGHEQETTQRNNFVGQNGSRILKYAHPLPCASPPCCQVLHTPSEINPSESLGLTLSLHNHPNKIYSTGPRSPTAV